MSDDPVLSDYLRLRKTSHIVTAQRFHQRLTAPGGFYESHGHVIRDADEVDQKNDLGLHIDQFHRGGAVG